MFRFLFFLIENPITGVGTVYIFLLEKQHDQINCIAINHKSALFLGLFGFKTCFFAKMSHIEYREVLYAV